MRSIKRLLILWMAVLLLCVGNASAQEGARDGFVSSKVMESRYFTIDLESGVDELVLIQRVGISPQDKILAGQSTDTAQFSSNKLVDLVDALFLWCCNVLDMQLYTYRGNLKIVRDESALAEVYRRLYGAERLGEKAFYVYEGNTIYVAASSFTKEIVGHEVAHAVISSFFVVQPPAKVQEVLAGYIEYQLRKTSVQP